METIESLPTDILIQIINKLDSESQLTLGTVSKFLAAICLKELWFMPECRSVRSLDSILTTIRHVDSTLFQYTAWLSGLSISFNSMETIAEPLPSLVNASMTVPLRSLRLQNLDGSVDACQMLFHALFQPDSLKSLEIRNCSFDLITSIASYMTLKNNYALETLSIQGSYLTDSLVKQLVSHVPNLRCFRSEASGYISDTSILAIVSSCPRIEEITITLPNYLVQSNTITFLSLEALIQSSHLTTFICKGQIRISNEESRQWLLANCPNLQYCDLSL